ncbi:MAG: hypothetical protein UV41_C0006G0038 [Candidatus Daviesbacteria bacterium GW2011_GWA2_42_7]|uniref:Uncharacterized protein n=3 Tax=Candidatus Daviesiibacteriota TaxID=1752718 RepID=A0A0G1AWA7_9BACT|nr:MAG: hypothetical protein UV33_C0009G0005 [Candidatus Daviesbacteria bacterium GW2011_GWA1_42_6]KKS71086.1 MAG: hypothetical protein UV41_C0006G0038 [Candidatus Daviesbacteria bacterium GW2011_GWA2_42_7]
MSMNYLERNELILQEVGEQFHTHAFRRGREVGQSHAIRFTAIGSYPSSVLGHDIHVGLKESIQGEELETRSDLELARIAVIAKHQPFLASALPVFYGCLTENGERTAIVMEDFSQGEKYKVKQWPYRWANIPSMSELLEAQKQGDMDYFSLLNSWLVFKEKLIHMDQGLEHEDYDLTSMCFTANNRLRLGDFDKLFFYRSMEQIFTDFPIDLTFEEFVEYTRRNQLRANLP